MNDLIKKILVEWSFRLDDGMINLHNSKHMIVLSEVLKDMDLPSWKHDLESDRVLLDDVLQSMKKIEPEDARPQYVVTVRGFGYKLKS